MGVNHNKVFAVVVTYNGRDDIEKCLSSLQASTVPVRILVIDNQSTDETVEIIRRNFSDVEFMVAPANLGFGKGNNIGIKHAYESGADHVFLLNQDAYVEPDTIEKLCTLQCENVEYGLLSPMQLDGAGKQLDFKFSTHLSKSPWIGEIFTDAFLSEGFQTLYKVDFLNAAAWMLSRNCIEKVGLFNPIFEHYGEDLEYAHRVLQKGQNVGISIQTIAYHNRDQVENVSIAGFHKTLMMTKALIRYRLCRKEPGTVTNLMSVFSLALFACGRTPMEHIVIKIRLLGFITFNSWITLAMKHKAYSTNLPFHKETPEFVRSSQ